MSFRHFSVSTDEPARKTRPGNQTGGKRLWFCLETAGEDSIIKLN